MACFRLLDAWQLGDGRIVFEEQRNAVRRLSLPCGQCIGCRLERSRQWAVRCVHESRLYDFSSFVTLTLSDEFLASMPGYCERCEERLHPLSLHYCDYQLFMKRVRRRFGPVRMYMCGEYGERTQRPHFHSLLFGLFFQDREVYRILPSGYRLYTSAELSRLWPFGHAAIGDVTFESAAYVARYCMKKVTGSRAASHYEAVDAETGEVVQRVPEFARMSLKPGIGAPWLQRFGKQVFPSDRVVMNGVEMKAPRYYRDLWRGAGEVMLPLGDTEGFHKISEDLVAVEQGRFDAQQNAAYDDTPERRSVREAVTKSRLSFKKRSI